MKKGVGLVSDKEVDVAIPSLESPQDLTMSSYSLTSIFDHNPVVQMNSSACTAMFRIKNRFALQLSRSPVSSINVLDVGGWINRSNDLTELWKNRALDAWFAIFEVKG